MKRSFISVTLLSLVCSVGAVAMEQGYDQYGQGKDYKQVKKGDCADAGQSNVQVDKVGKECADVGQISDQLGKTDIGQSCASSSSSQQCGASVQGESCTHQGSDQNLLWGQFGPKSEVRSWCSKKERFGHRVSYANWNGSAWYDIHATKARLYHVMAVGAKLDNVWLQGKFTHVKFDEATITNTTFSGKLRDVDFRHASLTNVLFTDADFDTKHLKRSNFNHAYLENVTFQKSNLEGMTFTDAKMVNVSFECSKIKDATCFKDADIWNPETNRFDKLSGTQLRNLGARISSCREGFFNISAWVHGL